MTFFLMKEKSFLLRGKIRKRYVFKLFTLLKKKNPSKINSKFTPDSLPWFYSAWCFHCRAFVENVGLPPVVQYLSWAPEGNKMASWRRDLPTFHACVSHPQAYSAVCLVTQAYVADYNVYVKANITAEAVQVTSNGKKNEILNGVPDWVYEGEEHSAV